VAPNGVTVTGDKGDLDRTFIGITGAYGISDKLDIYGTFASIMKAELEDVPSDGSGTAFAFGIRGAVPVGEAAVSAYAQYAMVDEDYGSADIFEAGFKQDIEGKGSELSAGIMASLQATKELSLYGGLELMLLSDAEIKIKAPGQSITFSDVEREDKFGFRVGAQYDAEAIGVFLSTAFGHETGFMLGVNKTF
jgi:hypothetical protein